MIVLQEYEDFIIPADRTEPSGKPRRGAAWSDGVTDLDHFRVQRRDRAGGAIHEYRLVA